MAPFNPAKVSAKCPEPARDAKVLPPVSDSIGCIAEADTAGRSGEVLSNWLVLAELQDMFQSPAE